MLSVWRCDHCNVNWAYAVDFKTCPDCELPCNAISVLREKALTYHDSCELAARVKAFRENEAEFNERYAERELRTLEADWLDSLLC